MKDKILNKLYELTEAETLILFLALALYLLWASQVTFDRAGSSAPDERMRFLLPYFIYLYNRLPTGFDPEVIYGIGGWSYAFYPQFLGPIVSAFFMNLTHFIRGFNTENILHLVYAARMTSVLSGITTVFFVNRTLRVLTENERVSLLGMALLAFWPQFAFLSSYINNDIISLAGISIMCYGTALSIKEQWTIKNAVILGIGMVICLLSYPFSYGFVLMFGVYFLISNGIDIKEKRMEWKAFWKGFATVFIIVAVMCLPFLARNALLYDGDIFGINSFNEAREEWEQTESMNWAYENARYWNETRDVPWNDGIVFEWIESRTTFVYRGGYISTGNPYPGTLLELFQDRTWMERTGKTAVTTTYFVFRDPFPDYFYYFYMILLVIPLLAITQLKKLEIKEKCFFAILLVGSLITVALFLYSTMTRDAQPQGRYFISVLIPLVMANAISLGVILNPFSLRVQKLVVFSMIAIYGSLLFLVLREFMMISGY